MHVDEAKPGQKITPVLAKKALTKAFKDNAERIYWETGIARKEAQELYKHLNMKSYRIAF